LRKKCKRVTFLLIVIACPLLMVVGPQLVRLTVANPQPISMLRMPEEYISYTITRVNGSLWAKVDGTYPIYKLDIECHDQMFWTNNTVFTFTGDALPMVYPTPPATTNISVKKDETELSWSNYTQIYHEATHYTALGDWSMISSTIYQVVDNFTLRIHYEHPIEQVNGSYMFLYDLNISPYLSPWSNKSIANFNIRFKMNYTDLQVNAITVNGTMNPLNYTIVKDETEAITLQVVSEYSKPLLGDILIAFTEVKESEQTNSPFSGFDLPKDYGYTLVKITSIVGIATVVAIVIYRRSLCNKK
jgi:hypothetical protein